MAGIARARCVISSTRHKCKSVAVGQGMAHIQTVGSCGRRAWAFLSHAPCPRSLTGAAIKFKAVSLYLIMGHHFSAKNCPKFLYSPQIIVQKESKPRLVTWSCLAAPLTGDEIIACHMYHRFISMCLPYVANFYS